MKQTRHEDSARVSLRCVRRFALGVAIALGGAGLVAPAAVSASDARAVEGRNVVFKIKIKGLSWFHNPTYRWWYRTVGKSAKSGEDFPRTVGKIEFTGHGPKTGTVSVPTYSDGRKEGDETFILQLFNFQRKIGGQWKRQSWWSDWGGYLHPGKVALPGKWQFEGTIIDKYDDSCIGPTIRGGSC